jgi:nucleoside phosphorylase
MSPRAEQRADILIVTAIPLEFDAVLKVDAGAAPGSVWIEDKQTNGVAMAYRSFLPPGGQPLEVAVAVAGDMATAALLSALIPLIDQLHPRCIAMCGVCAGRPGKVQLGDVVAAERLFYHDTGKQSREDGKPELMQQDLRTFNLRIDWKIELERMNAAKIFRGQSWLNDRPLPSEWRITQALWALERGVTEPSHEVDETLKDGEWKTIVDFLREKRWLEGVELTDTGRSEAKRRRFDYPGTPDLSPHGDVLPFKLHVAPMASGNKVVEDNEIWAFISESMRKTLGLDMEAA